MKRHSKGQQIQKLGFVFRFLFLIKLIVWNVEEDVGQLEVLYIVCRGIK